MSKMPSQVENIINKLEQEGNVNLPINQKIIQGYYFDSEDIEKLMKSRNDI